ncbi:MAG: hypothetical protein DWQ07_12275 [Chloroflexi bacterium]|nr:MAG: hypothetical protein DWQ07_12275 [Chloroflexota bacterium]
MIIDNGFMDEFRHTRMCSIEGYLGAGKTLIALAIAEPFLKEGYRLITNMSCVWNDEHIEDWDIEEGLKAVIIVDEGGLYLRTMKSVSDISSFARKLDCYLIFAGRRLPHEELCELILSPSYDFQRNWGLPFFRYKWTVNPQLTGRYSGWLFFAGRSGYFGIYDTVDPGDSAEVVVRYIERQTGRLFKHYNRTYDVQDVSGSGGYDTADEAGAHAASSARQIQNAISLLANQTQGKKRRAAGR